MIKRRELLMQVLLTIVTLGIFSIYWFYVTSKEMIEYKRLDQNAVLWLVLGFIPVIQLYAWYKHGEAVEALTDGSINKWLMLLLWIFFIPAVWLITHLELNKRATEPA